ncbi:MAG TPA: phosphoglucomutase (alpha-D-glucose-1,6-bisphosphate-dependent) [Anaeromyxobacteraceae bacterium]|nr:phosphoglucomutase (alpha-D-glucose-1,6-bisphosphate-dependent) [Anaeromyxobacteraceae bacterium]
MVHPLAGKPAPRSLLIDLTRLVDAYVQDEPDPADALQRVSFGTSGHRGSSLRKSFNEAHVLAIVQAVCDYRTSRGTSGPLFLGKDTHALSDPAQRTALEVLAANGVDVFVAASDAPTPTPVISHAILSHNRGRDGQLADGIVITPSHNPPEDGGIKYNPPSGGPADSVATSWIEQRANALLEAGNTGTKRIPFETALRAPTTRFRDYVGPYVTDLESVIDFAGLRRASLKLGVDPMGGSNVGYWDPIARTYGLSIEVVNRTVDPTFAFMTLDYDGKIRMDCSSPYAMASLVSLKDRFDLAFGNDADSDRHGIVTPSSGLMVPNHYLCVAISWLFGTRRGWPAAAGIGKTLVSSALIDRVAKRLGRNLWEVPVGFKWFVSGLLEGSIGFGGEESAGASFLRRDGTVWSTDKDGIIMDLLAAEIRAVSGRDPGRYYEDLAGELGRPVYTRIDAPATLSQKARLKALSADAVKAGQLAGEPIRAKLTRAPGNGAEIGGLKVVAESGWFAARPSGTEDVYKIYAESFRDEDHLQRVIDEARAIVAEALGA